MNSDDWIKCEDELPIEEDFYLVYEHGRKTVRQFNVYHNCWDDEQGDDYYCDAVGDRITHWQPLPGDPV